MRNLVVIPLSIVIVVVVALTGIEGLSSNIIRNAHADPKAPKVAMIACVGDPLDDTRLIVKRFSTSASVDTTVAAGDDCSQSVANILDEKLKLQSTIQADVGVIIYTFSDKK